MITKSSVNNSCKKNILVIGGAGYIGSHTCKALAMAGYTPITYDNLINGNRRAVRWGPLEVGDITDRFKLDSIIARYRPSAVMHFAAYAYVGESVRDPGKYYRNNVTGTLILAEAMRDHGIDKLVFSSTCATYGIPVSVPISEEHPQNPINPYGASKLMIERVLQDFYNAYGLRSILLRYFNAAGADPDGEIGEMHDPETHLIPLVLAAAGDTCGSLTLHGNDYETPDGTCIRDYIHVSDLADAHLLALRALESGHEMRAYNLGNGQGFSVREVIDSVERVTGKRARVEIGPRRTGDPAILVGDATRAIAELNWKPKFTKIDDMIETAWRWHSINSSGDNK